ncbi:MAG TPA: glycosyltransferase family 2 protein [Acidimicrobiia bacterium]|nr:glycosyltransferase family 2 protein [Acidimicrobiia bacterium]
MTTSVVVVSYRVHRWLDRCLASVIGVADEVILVDNGSPGEAVAAVGRRCGASVHVLPQNLGFACGVNAGLRQARGDVVALLNDDAVADPKWLAASAGALADPTVAAVGPKITFLRPCLEVRIDDEPKVFPPDLRPLGRQLRRIEVGGVEVPLDSLSGPGVHKVDEETRGAGTERWRWTSGPAPFYVPIPEDAEGENLVIDGQSIAPLRTVHLINNAGSYLSANGFGGDYGFGAHDDGRFALPAERFATTGAAMAARAETFARIGGLAESYFVYYEDLDWCWRARLAGMRCLYEPASTVRHVGGATTGGPTADRVRRLAARNRLQTLARNAPLPILWSQLRSSVDRPESGMALPITRRVIRGLAERRGLSRLWRTTPADVWAEWAGRDETW